MKPPDEQLGTLLRVPNTPEGKAFLKQLRAYAIKGTRVRARGRGPRAKPALANGHWRRSYDQSIPLRHSEYFAVYIDKPALQLIAKGQVDKDIATIHELYRQNGVTAKVIAKIEAEVMDLRPRRKINL